MSNRHVVVTASDLERLSSEGSLSRLKDSNYSAEVYIAKPLTAEKIEGVVTAFLLKHEQLFFPAVFKVLTEPIEEKEEIEVRAAFRKAGYNVTVIDSCEKRGKYLCSSGGGHYSTDFYEWIKFGCVSITPT